MWWELISVICFCSKNERKCASNVRQFSERSCISEECDVDRIKKRKRNFRRNKTKINSSWELSWICLMFQILGIPILNSLENARSFPGAQCVVW